VRFPSLLLFLHVPVFARAAKMNKAGGGSQSSSCKATLDSSERRCSSWPTVGEARERR
jgi:hypothetical protein